MLACWHNSVRSDHLVSRGMYTANIHDMLYLANNAMEFHGHTMGITKFMDLAKKPIVVLA